jgi:hypothetical protein
MLHITILKREKVYISAHSFRNFSSWFGWPIAFGSMARQSIMVGECSRESCSPRGGQEANEKDCGGRGEKRERERKKEGVQGPNISFKYIAPNEQKTFTTSQ